MLTTCTCCYPYKHQCVQSQARTCFFSFPAYPRSEIGGIFQIFRLKFLNFKKNYKYFVKKTLLKLESHMSWKYLLFKKLCFWQKPLKIWRKPPETTKSGVLIWNSRKWRKPICFSFSRDSKRKGEKWNELC